MSDPLDTIRQASSQLRQAIHDIHEELKTERGRKRGALVKALFELETHFDRSVPFPSQAGQDRIVDRALGFKEHGIFVDVGGYNGVKGSNTLFFETFRNWIGILIEPSPTQLRNAQRFRKCDCIGAAVSGEAGTSEFLEITGGYTQMSGFLSSYQAGLLDKVRKHPEHAEVLHTLDHVLLGDLLQEHSFEKVDFISLDVEGGEMGILESFDFDQFDVEMWSIENNTQTSDLPNFMRSKGYELIEFAGVDDIFRKRT